MGVALLLLVSGCTSEEPSVQPPGPDLAPEPTASSPVGARVGIVTPPITQLDPAVLASLEAQLARLEIATPDTVRQLRGYPAADGPFVADVALWLAEQGTDLVCVIGDGAEQAVTSLAERYRGLRFCALPTGPPPDIDDDATEGTGSGQQPDGIARVEIRAEELGYVVGTAARAQAGGEAVGLVLGGDELPDDRFRLGLLAGLSGTEVVEADPAPDVTLTLSEQAEAVLGAGVAVVVIDGADGASRAVELVGGRAVVMAPGAVLGSAGPGPGPRSLGWTVRWDRALAGPLAALDTDRGAEMHTTVGLTDEVFEFALGRGLAAVVTGVVAEATEGIGTGEIDPSVPAPDPEPRAPPARPGPEDADGDDADDDDPDGADAGA